MVGKETKVFGWTRLDTEWQWVKIIFAIIDNNDHIDCVGH